MLFAAGGQEAEEDTGTATTTAPAGAEVPQPGTVLFYATLEEYESQTGNTITSFNEAPMLASRVSSGELPPLEERLPDEPMVVKPKDSIGKYGGKVRCSATSPTTGGAEAWTFRTQPLFRVVPTDEGDKVIPNVAKGYELSSDYTTLTVYLRKRLKWSDGEPFTADDMMFWYEDIYSNREIMPVATRIWTPEGNPVVFEKVDDLTVNMKFESPYPSIIDFLGYEARMYYNVPFAPKHYLSQFHIKYNPDADKVAKEKNYDDWVSYFQYVYPNEVQQRWEVDVPTVDAWTMTEVDSYGNKYFERNPYYYKVDIAGNQLPYIDQQDRLLFENAEVINLTVIAGGLDYAQQDLLTDNYTLYKENEEKGDYKAMMWFDGRGQVLCCHKLNMNHPDPVLRDLFNNSKFRQALSIAINRDEINEAVFRGLASPRTASVRSDVSFFEPEWENHWGEYDPEMAKQLLDEIGLGMDSAGKYRLRPDGETLEFNLEYVEMEGPRGKVEELVKEYWEAIGIKTGLKRVEQNLWGQRGNAGELDMSIWNLDATNEVGFHASAMSHGPYANDWWDWYTSNGEAGEEPPDYIKRFYTVCEQLQAVPLGSEEYTKVAKEKVSIYMDNMWNIGIIGNMPKPTIIRSGLRNTPETGVRIYAGYRFWMIYDGDQWYWE